MKTVKISEHRARIIEALQSSGYVRETDHKIIICDNEFAKIDGRKIAIEAIDDKIQFQGYTLTGITDQALTWSKVGEADIVWRKGHNASLRKVAEFLSTTSKGLTSTWTAKDEAKDLISCRTSEAGTPTHTTVRDVKEMVIPTLKEIDFLATHFEQAEALAINLGTITHGNVRPHLKVALTMKTLDSLREVPSVGQDSPDSSPGGNRTRYQRNRYQLKTCRRCST